MFAIFLSQTKINVLFDYLNVLMCAVMDNMFDLNYVHLVSCFWDLREFFIVVLLLLLLFTSTIASLNYKVSKWLFLNYLFLIYTCSCLSYHSVYLPHLMLSFTHFESLHSYSVRSFTWVQVFLIIFSFSISVVFQYLLVPLCELMHAFKQTFKNISFLFLWSLPEPWNKIYWQGKWS